MRSFPKIAVAIVGASVLVGSLLTDALARQPGPLQPMSRTHDKKFAVNGSLNVTGVLRVNKNLSDYGKVYAHGGLQVWQGLKVTSGVLSTVALEVTGSSPATFSGGATVKGTLAADAITGSTLSMSGTASIGGKLTANGVDGGASGLSTSGDVTAGGSFKAGSNVFSGTGLTTNALTVSGTFSAANISTTGTITAGSTTVTTLNATNLKASGTVDLTGANVTGLNLGGIGTTFSSLTVGAAAATQAPLSIQQNNQTAKIGVDTNGVLQLPPASIANTGTSTPSLSISGTLSVVGSGGITAGLLTAPISSGSTLGTLTLAGNPVTLSTGSDFSFTSSTSTASHLLANGDFDLASQLTVNIPGGTTAGSEVTPVQVSFRKAFVTLPIVTVTAAGNPEPGNASPKVWVEVLGSSGNYTGFKLHYAPGVTEGTNYTVTYDVHVIGL